MLRILPSLLLCVWLTLAPLPRPVADALRSGELLRVHILAQDDTDAMQSLKQPVRDAVGQTYLAHADPGRSMLENAQTLLPLLTRTAQEAAKCAGFEEDVTVSLDTTSFGARVLEGMLVPAGDYPALIIRMGAGNGHNWWGLIDPQRSLLAACAELDGGEGITWDWSLGAIWEALGRSLRLWRGGAAQ